VLLTRRCQEHHQTGALVSLSEFGNWPEAVVGKNKALQAISFISIFQYRGFQYRGFQYRGFQYRGFQYRGFQYRGYASIRIPHHQ
jgi:hypothetical protein